MVNMHSIHTKLVFSLLGLIIVPVIIVAASLFNSSSSIIQEEVSSSIQNKLIQTSNNIDHILNNTEYSTVNILLDNDLYTILTQKLDNIQSSYKDLEDLNYIKSSLNKLTLYNPYVDSVYLFNLFNDSLFISNMWGYRLKSDINYSEWHNKIKTVSKGHSWISGPGIIISGTKPKNYIYCIKYIQRKDDAKPIAILTVNIDERTIYQLLKEIKVGKTGVVFLTDENGKIISYPGQSNLSPESLEFLGREITSGKEQGSFLKKINGTNQLITFITSKEYGWRYVAIVPVEEIMGKVDNIRNLAVLVAFISILAAFIVAFLLSRSIYNPIHNLLIVMEKVEKGSLDVSIKQERKDEFGELFIGFNNMINRVKSLIEQLYHQELLKKNAEIKALQSQIHPHFLYNTLDAIHWIARINKVDEICQITFALSKFFRLVLSGGKDIVTVEEALNLTNYYLTIQQIRHKNRFIVEVDFDPSIKHLEVPKLIFQPLVENAINHGIDRKREAGLIKISGKLENDVFFTIWDDGIGISEEKLMKIKSALADTNIINTDYFALRNLNHQIRILYGDNYGVEISSKEGCWTEVKITVPFLNREVNNV